jgi:hypothetical protein
VYAACWSDVLLQLLRIQLAAEDWKEEELQRHAGSEDGFGQSLVAVEKSDAHEIYY